MDILRSIPRDRFQFCQPLDGARRYLLLLQAPRRQTHPDAVSAHQPYVLDPYYEFGGFTQIKTLCPGQVGTEKVLLNKYFKFYAQGKYAVNCSLDVDIKYDDGTQEKVVARDTIYICLVEDSVSLDDLYRDYFKELQSGNAKQQLEILGILGELCNEKTIYILATALNSSNTALIEAAISGLLNLNVPEAIDVLKNFRNQNGEPENLKSLVAQAIESR